MILAHEKDISFTEIYFFFSQCSNSVGKYEFLFQFTCLQPHLHIQIHAPRTHITQCFSTIYFLK